VTRFRRFLKALRFYACLGVLLVSALCSVLKAEDQQPAKAGSNGPASPSGYHVVGRYPIGEEGGWDYISIVGHVGAPGALYLWRSYRTPAPAALVLLLSRKS
jgi:hypothetical protein